MANNSAQNAETAQNSAEAAEASRQSTHGPQTGAGDPGVVLDGASGGDLATLGMSPDVEIPTVDYGEQPADYRS
jgi:hypothetical protein